MPATVLELLAGVGGGALIGACWDLLEADPAASSIKSLIRRLVIMELLLAALLISNNPYAWEMSCQRWHESRAEILMDENLPAWEKDLD